jgi:hypothetical protein
VPCFNTHQSCSTSGDMDPRGVRGSRRNMMTTTLCHASELCMMSCMRTSVVCQDSQLCGQGPVQQCQKPCQLCEVRWEREQCGRVFLIAWGRWRRPRSMWWGSWGVLDRAGKMVEGAGCLIKVEHVEPEKTTTGQLSAAWRRSSICGEEQVGRPHCKAPCFYVSGRIET